MGSGFEHAALAAFTTLAPMAAASFIALAYAFMAGKPDAQAAKRLDRWTAVPAAVMIVGFVAAFMHLASPLNALGVFGGVGTSPLSNEIAVGLAFAVVALVYWVLALAGKLAHGARTAFLVALSALALLFAAFCGAAYLIGTIPTWNTPFSVVQMVGYALVGGTVLGFSVVGFAHVELPEKAGAVALALALAGVVVGIVGFGGQIAGVADLRNIWGAAEALVPAIWMLLGAFAVCGIAGAVITFIAAKKAFSPVLMIAACVIVAVGIFVARIGFYGLYMGIAL